MGDSKSKSERAPAPFDEGLDVWRERLTTTGLWCLGTTALVAYGFVTLQGMVLVSNPAYPAYPIITAIALAGAVARGASLRLRMAVLVLALLAAGLCGLAAGGITPNAFVVLSLGVVTTGLLFGARAGLVYVALSIVGVLGVSALYRASVLSLSADWLRHMDIHSGSVITRVILTFGVLATGLLFTVRYMLERTEDLLARNAVANVELRREQAEREGVQRELAERETAYRKGAELELLGRLAGYAAHDFNNALMVIQGNAELAQLNVSDPDVISALDAIMTASRQAAATTRQLRAFGPQAPHEERQVSLAAATERVSRLLQALLPSNVECSVVIESPDAIAVEEGELQRVVTNLSLNARDAMREGGRLTLRVFAPTTDHLPEHLRHRGPWVALEVKDTGHGMDAPTQARIFEPYFTTKGDAGTGLGLASVRELVRARGGDVTVASEIDRGTQIAVYWPRADALVAKSASTAAPDREVGTVLIVDDNPAVRAVISRVLVRAGLLVVEAGNGDEAVGLAARHATPIDAMVTDASMPGMPLRELLAQFRARFPAAGVLLCSGSGPDALGHDNTPLTFDAFVPKPFEPHALVTAVNTLIAARRAKPV